MRVSAAQVGNNKVGLTVSVHIRHCQRIGSNTTGAIGHYLLEGPVTVAQQYAHAAVVATISHVRHQKVGLTIAVDVSYRYSLQVPPARVVGHRLLECPV